ncbi:Gamma-glutamylputrescine synthetase PuuA [Pseudooceanicola marinus]|uniref:Gamma-glutamylputrescine synthetase PuuA n=1 Tax=Pseudooceanicola marinus TaxID=396013 RepID=A0A1X6Y4T3_9RHOB|nr:glutamine synthetase family protein [Pseudooceanicola marinus]PJE33390.1 glutamine synthetase [Pseudooceanicola marinus]SLN10366.1 Gamma-glutamylputrescine synthetase PuuA [Pseudooceanicola marinus]
MHFDQYRTFRVAAADLNGQMRGKRVPLATFDKLGTEGTRMPLSVLNVDVWGADIDDSPLVFASGDEDGVLKPTEHGPVPMPWLDSPSALVPMWMFHDDGSPFAGDPRHALRRVLDRYKERGWTVQAAVEMEFYLVDDTGHQLAAPQNPISGRPVFGNAILSIRQLDAFDNFLTDLYDACDAMEIPADSASSEAGLGQFEINLDHRDAMAAADDAWLFKAMVRGMARRHDMAATFMAKPFANDAGNGMHVHFSVLDEDGNNIFDNGGPEGTPLLKNAVAGCLAGLAPGTLIWAPHGTSYDRFTPGSHAPTGGCWAYENRTAAIRIPSGPAKARRIEHRVACGDINPYLVLAAILGSALAGIEDEMDPPAPITGNAYDLKLPGLMPDWESALERFETDPLMARIFTPELIRNFAMTKRQEIRRLAEIPPEEHWLVYLETV